MADTHKIGKWELICIVFNTLIYRIFTDYPINYFKNAGSAAWLNAIVFGLIFLIIFWAILCAYDKISDIGLIEYLNKKFGKIAYKAASLFACVISAYFSVSLLISVCFTLKTVTFNAMSSALVIILFVVGCGVAALCGRRAVCRIHSLFLIGIILTIALTVVLTTENAYVSNLFPMLGKGIENTFIRGFVTIGNYCGILLIFFLPTGNTKYSFKKTAFFSALAAVVLNIITILSISLNMSYELLPKLTVPIYPLTKAASIGKIPARLDFAYQWAFMTSAFLFLSLCFSVLSYGLKNLSFKLKHKSAAAVCLFLVLTLTGCNGAKEVEENAFVTAIGIDKGESDRYKYTFQISNPLSTGGGTSGEGEEKSESNESVDNIVIEAFDFGTAKNNLRSIVSKEIELSHLKLIVFSEETAKDGGLSHAEMLFVNREVRPSARVALTESAEKYLKGVQPTLEENTVRYYELFFGNRELPYAPVCLLTDFVGRSASIGFDAVVPYVTDNCLSGMGIFSDGILTDVVNKDDVVIYKLLCGELKDTTIRFDDKSAVLKNEKKPKINIDTEEEKIKIDIKLYVSSDLDIEKDLKERCERFLYHTSETECDILGLGRRIKKFFPTEIDWERFDWKTKFKNCNFFVDICIKNGEISKNLQ